MQVCLARCGVCVCVCVCVCVRARLHVCINICTLYLWKTEINMITNLCNHCDIDSSPPLRPPCLMGSWTDRQSWRHSCVFPAALSPTISVMPLSSKPPVPNKYILQTGNRITLDWYNNTNSYRYLEINNNKKHRPPPPKKKKRQKKKEDTITTKQTAKTTSKQTAKTTWEQMLIWFKPRYQDIDKAQS